METTGFGILGLYWGYIEIMEKKMETTGFGTLGLYWDNGKENGNYRVWYIGVILGLY